jgi:transcriptional regulator with PAS, ATPase and Fis domain
MSRRPAAVVLAPVMRSAAMRKVDALLQAVAAREVAVILLGESGTGKEVLARRIHERSERRRGPFVPINCAAIPEALFESELFGHERGAFTGATERARGKVEAAAGGTLFLDEIGEMPVAMQAKLLRFLEHRRFMRVGGTTKLLADVRMLFATLRPLERDVATGRFRADLYYRIGGIAIAVPPLRERRADVLPLLDQFVRQLSAQHGTPPPRFGRQARAALVNHAWPGNVRELRNLVELLCLTRGGKVVRPVDLPAAVRDPTGPRTSTLTVDLDAGLAAIVEQVLGAALALEGGHRGRAAHRLGISVRTLERRLAGAR